MNIFVFLFLLILCIEPNNLQGWACYLLIEEPEDTDFTNH